MTRLNKAELAAIQEAKDTMSAREFKNALKGVLDAPNIATTDNIERRKKATKLKALKEMKSDKAYSLKEGGLAEATAKLKAKGMKEGGMVVKDKTVAIDKSPNSGLITVKGFGAGRRT